MIAVLVITDGRIDYLLDCVTSARKQLHGPVSEWWMYDDTGDSTHRAWLGEQFPDFTHVNAGPRQGFGGAIRSAWAHLIEDSQASFIFHVEQDFTFNRPIPLGEMAMVLDSNPHLAQLALRRQPWNDTEREAGGIVEQHPDDYVDCTDGDHAWLEHARFFTTNPSLYRASLMRQGWPHGPQSEGRFGIGLRQRIPETRFGFWGARDSGEWVEHIGHARAGIGY